MLQRDKAHLFEVTFSMAYLLQFWELNSDISLATKLIGRLERCWNKWEQPILLFYYYRAWTGQEPKCILCEFNNFYIKNNPFDDETYQQFKDDVLSYWCYIKDATDELGLVACKIFGICVNTTSVERLWSCMGFIQTNRRCQLKTPKALNMSKLRADITYQHRREPDDLFFTF
ncbi:40183_t:CDS:2 [Gigaspora margarita]|uniref:40183_t:CDS:1 n=1 Tax=Gigaspora margarita TaxID=4874 RepID=A0ABN7VA93_GIGMA|nr:40183_t:CDS:2 [Gigaspora margarita]